MTFASDRALHGDIMVEWPAGNDLVVAIGGLVGDSVKCRRHPLESNHPLVVDRVQLYEREDDSGNLPNLPDTDNKPGVHPQSDGRVIALLKPVEGGAVVPGQPVGARILV